MVREEIDLTLSDDDDDVEEERNDVAVANQHAQPQPIKPIKYESQYAEPVAAAVANNSNGDEGLKPATTGGKGLWSLWTRNFKSTLLMLLDLVDNSVDAAMQQDQSPGGQFTGRVHIYRDIYHASPGQTFNTGLCIRNNSPKKITPLKDVLKLFISNKQDGTESIGENGVGLKQSCAALSDLSFVLVKNGTDKVELGILAKALQRDEGCFLPSFEFTYGSTDLQQQMMDVFSKPTYKDVAACVAEYGRVRSGGTPNLSRGISRLIKHFEDIHTKFFDSPNVFEVIIDKVVHRGSSDNTITNDGKNIAVSDIINELQHEIPRRYLHIPENSFVFTIGKKKLSFKYWPERLVEFSCVEIPVRSQTPWSVNFGDLTPDSYHLRVYIGFDRYRIKNPDSGVVKNKPCSLYVYSRSSGRLITYEPDARNILGLTGGGTVYCQGLTIIVDDIDGHLPLDPTKQGIAFGNESHGNVHEENLYAVVHAVTIFYYNYHKNKFGGSSGILRKKIEEFSDADLPENVKTCRNSELTDYGVLFILTKGNRIQVDRTCYEDEIVGNDTYFRLIPDDAQIKQNAAKKSAHRSKKATSSPSKKKQKADEIRKSPIRKTKRASAVTPSPARKKQSSAKRRPRPPANSDEGAKKRQRAETSQSTKPKGSRSSSRKSSRPQRYGKYSDEESEEESVKEEDEGLAEDDESNGRKSNKNVTEDLIDLCESSSDEEDEVVDKGTTQAPTIVTSNSPDANESLQNDVAENDAAENDEDEATGTNMDTIEKDRVALLEVENAELKARVSALQTENDSLEKEVKSLREELEGGQKKSAMSNED